MLTSRTSFFGGPSGHDTSVRYQWDSTGVDPKIGVWWAPKMDGENNGSKPYEQMDDLGFSPIIFGNIHMSTNTEKLKKRDL